MIERLSSNSYSSQPRIYSEDKNSIQAKEPSEDKQEIQPKQLDLSNKNEELEEIVQSMNKFIQPTHTSLKFELHDELNEYYVTIVDDTTKEVIKEIPSKKMLDMYAAMTDFLGLIVDKKI